MTQIKVFGLSPSPDTVRRSGQASADRGRNAMRRLAWACALLMVVVITASAWLRLAQPRPACATWPACRGVSGPAASAVAPVGPLADPGVIGVARAVHRVAATLVLTLALTLAVLALVQRRRCRGAAGLAFALVGLAVALALLGIVTPGSRAPPVLLGNLLGGLLMFGLAWRLATRLGAAPAVSRPLARWAAGGAALVIVQAALGALSGAGSGAATSIAHVGLAFVAVPWMIAVGNAAGRQGRRADGGALSALAVTQAVLGLVAVLSAAQPALVLAHNVVAAFGLALLLGLSAATLQLQTRATASGRLAPSGSGAGAGGSPLH